MARRRRQGGPSRYDQIIGQIQMAEAHAKTDLRNRVKRIKELESAGDPQPRRVAMYYARLDRIIAHDDVLPFTSMLRGIGRVENLDLIVHSPGGYGQAADKMIDLCRKYCTGKLRIVVPLYAKSAATLMALAADEIVMGETSEIGPIDAQLTIMQDGIPQQVSADHFLRAEEEATKKIRSDKDEIVEAGRIQLASLSAALLQACRDSQEFAKQFGRKQLRAHMFSAEYATDEIGWRERINKIVDNLTSSGKHLSHGKMITAADIKSDEDLKCLKIISLSDTDPYWIALDDLLHRTDIVVRSQEYGKVLMARNFQMVGM